MNHVCRSGLYKEERREGNFRIRQRGGKDAQGIDQFPGEETLEPFAERSEAYLVQLQVGKRAQEVNK